MAANGEAWAKKKVENLAEYITVGFVGSMSSLFVDEGVPLLRGQNIRPYSLDLTNLKYISHETHRKWKKSALKPGDVVIVRVGYPGTACVIPEAVGDLNAASLVIVRPNPALLDSDYLSYVINSPWGKAQVAGRLVGAAQQVFNNQTAAELEIPAPPLPMQRRIAGNLSAYDELMENSQRRIRILEAMARALYREWFVHFRFPGHKTHPRVASPLGDIPKRWEAIPFEKLLVSMTGGHWGSEHPDEDDSAEVGIVRGTDFDEVAYGGDLRVPVRYIKPSSLKSRGLRVGDVIVENSVNAKSRCIGTPLLVNAHVLARLGRDAVAASFCKVFRLHDPRLAPLVHLHFRHLREDARMEYYQDVAANGIGNFQAQRFAEEEHLILPGDPKVRAEFLGRIAALMDGVSLLASEIQNLRRTRDLLLPRLLSGQISLRT